ncbi:MAG: methyltransferase domain-containing protein [Nitrospiraceae bacterium]|nr:methyltransferase domain-containing protein [Nitrospiraceae bacterium]
MSDKRVPADYTDMTLAKAQHFDKLVKENFMPAIISTARQVIEDYGILEGVCLDVGCGTAVFALELCRRSKLKIYALEKINSIYEVARMNIKKEGMTDRIVPVLGDAHSLPFEDKFVDLVISRGSYHCWEDKALVFQEIYRVLKRGGIGLVGGGFGRYVTKEEIEKMAALRDRSLKDDAELYKSPNKLEDIIHRAGISNFHIIHDRTGLWAEIKKSE